MHIPHKIILSAFLCVMLCSCISPLSMQPLSNPDDFSYDERLNGTWYDKENEVFFHVGHKNHGPVHIVAIDHNHGDMELYDATFFISILKTGNIMNIRMPDDFDCKGGDKKGCYAFVKYEIEEPDTLRISPLSESSVKEAVEQGHLKGKIMGDDVLITDETKHIIGFIESNDTEVFRFFQNELKRLTEESRNYFPEDLFDSDFLVKWYSRHLLAMREPLLVDSVNGSIQQAYRFLWLRTFDKPISIRLMVNASGDGSLTVKVLSGAGGYHPGILDRDMTIPVSKENVEKFTELLKTAAFWELPTNESDRGLDGAEWIIEGIERDKYHVVDRWSPKEGAFREAALYLLRLSKLEVEEVY